MLKVIQFYGQKYGGTNSSDRVYISNIGIAYGYNDRYLEKSFHHEFSSVLLRKYPRYFNKKAWKNLSKLPYDLGGVNALKQGKDSQTIDSSFNINGFLYQYATSVIENDFDSFAENLFSPAAGFWEAVEKYPLLKKKADIIIGFYNHLNKIFTKQYFLSFST